MHGECRIKQKVCMCPYPLHIHPVLAAEGLNWQALSGSYLFSLGFLIFLSMLHSFFGQVPIEEFT